MISLGIKYSMCDLICDVNYCASEAKVQNASYNVDNVNASFIISLSQAANIPLLNHLLDGNSCKIYFISFFCTFEVFSYNFIICTYLSHVADTDTAIDDVTN